MRIRRPYEMLLVLAATAVFSGPFAAAADAPPAPPAPAVPTMSPGDIMPTFDATALDGSTTQIRFPKGHVTVMVFFLSSCHVCHSMMPEWNRAFERMPEGIHMIGVMLDKAPPRVLADLAIQFPVVYMPEDPFRQQIKVHRVPQTMRIKEGGVIEDVAMGKIDAMRLGEFFGPVPAAAHTKPAKSKGAAKEKS
jgi:hypothetical protein